MDTILHDESDTGLTITTPATAGSMTLQTEGNFRRHVTSTIALTNVAVPATITVAIKETVSGIEKARYSRRLVTGGPTSVDLQFSEFEAKDNIEYEFELTSTVADTVDWQWLVYDSRMVNVGELIFGQYKIADTTGNWATAGTWEDGVVPAAGDNIIIRDGVTVTIAADNDLGQFGTLELQGNGEIDEIAAGQTVAVVPRGWCINSNSGTVTLNFGSIIDNAATVTTNSGLIHSNTGTVTGNLSNITANDGTVTLNEAAGTIATNSGTVTTNDGRIILNVDTVTTNSANGTVLHNYGTITTDNGKSDVPRVTLVVTTRTNTDLAPVDAKVDQILEGNQAIGGSGT